MPIHEMRKAIRKVYDYGTPNKWTAKVDKMNDDQVLAVYRSFQQRGLVK